jgi:hypothetical protein
MLTQINIDTNIFPKTTYQKVPCRKCCITSSTDIPKYSSSKNTTLNYLHFKKLLYLLLAVEVWIKTPQILQNNKYGARIYFDN